jgi:predicted metalloendopeptidase
MCTTKTCVTVASSILNAMDDTVDPCEDFYQFACGGWIKAHPIPPGESRWDAFGVLRKENQVVLKNILGRLLGSKHSFIYVLDNFTVTALIQSFCLNWPDSKQMDKAKIQIPP